MIKRIAITFYLLSLIIVAQSQTDFKQPYFNGKNFFREGKYNLAMESFKKVTPYDQSNPFSEYASYYFALSAYRQGYMAVTKDMLLKIKSLYPKWDKMDEVDYLLAAVHFNGKDYFQGLKLLNGIKDDRFQQDINSLKQQAVTSIQDVETLRLMSEEYPKDEIIAKAFAKALLKSISNEDYKALLETVIKKFNFNRGEYFQEVPKTVYKDMYSVSVLFPFMLNTLDPTPTKKRNQPILDIYEGMRLAVDTLSKQGININMRAYDTERNAGKIKKILAAEELKNTDLIVGPFFPEENKIVHDFSMSNKINAFNPVTNNSDHIVTNLFAYLFQPSFETLGKKSAEYVAASARKKNCLVIYGNSKRDSLLAANFIQKAGELNLKVLTSHKVNKESVTKVVTLLTTATEYDEFHYPKEFTIKKDSVGSIFVASDDALIYSKIIYSVETRNDGIVIVGSETWLENADYEKYERLGIVLASPNYTYRAGKNYQIFLKKYIKTHGLGPSTFSRMGYEFMLFAGAQLKKNGVYFQEALNKEQWIPGFLTQGFNYQSARDNQLVPFVGFRGGELVLLGKR